MNNTDKIYEYSYHPIEKESKCISHAQFFRELDKVSLLDRTMYQMFAFGNASFGDWWKAAENYDGMYIVTFTKKNEEDPFLSYIKFGKDLYYFKGHYRFYSMLPK